MRIIALSLLLAASAAATHVTGLVRGPDGNTASTTFVVLTNATYIGTDGAVVPRRSAQIPLVKGIFDAILDPGPYTIGWGGKLDTAFLIVPPTPADVSLSSCIVFPPDSTLCTDTGPINFVDFETPIGVPDGSNRVFTLQHAPGGKSLQLFENGVLVFVNFDYTLSGSTITFIVGSEPSAGSRLFAWYRY